MACGSVVTERKKGEMREIASIKGHVRDRRMPLAVGIFFFLSLLHLLFPLSFFHGVTYRCLAFGDELKDQSIEDRAGAGVRKEKEEAGRR